MIRSVVSEYCREILPKDYHTVTEYRVNIMGKFPIEGVMDDKGYIPLLGERDVRMEHVEDDGEKTFVGHRIMGVDCAGEGDDKTVWVIRDRIRANVVHEEAISTPEGIAMKTVTLAERYGIRYEDYGDIIIDGFGVGHSVAQEIAVITKGKGDRKSVV